MRIPGIGRLNRRQRTFVSGLAIVTLLITLLGLWWDFEPRGFDVEENAQQLIAPDDTRRVGALTTATLIGSVNVLLTKKGGYLSNDRLPPGVFLDNVPNWEWGVLRQCRDMAQVLRNDFARSQTQSTEDEDLVIAETKLHIDSDAWMFPAAEAEYGLARDALLRYLTRLQSTEAHDAQFFARADNLRAWLGLVEKRLGDLSQRLSASVGQVRINTDLSGDSAATRSTGAPEVQVVKTNFFDIDDIFFEARGTSWALIHFLKAVEQDFAPVLDKKNARVSLRQIIRELEATQDGIWSPLILNGTGFGVLANHSLVMASYISRANAAVIDLRDLLEQG